MVDFALILGIATLSIGIFLAFVAIRMVQQNNDSDMEDL